MMNDERKEIIIDPVMFNISNNKSKKIREKVAPKIKVKGQKPERKNKASTLKKNLLRMIRGHQEKRMKEQNKPILVTTHLPESLEAPKSDFEQSISFLSQINKLPVEPKVRKNLTLRQPSLQPQKMTQQPVFCNNNNNNNIKNPNYGCMKNGTLPTYRVWKNQTQRQNIAPLHQIPKSIMTSPIQMNYESQLRDKIKEMSEREQHQKLKQKQKIWKKPKKQRRILRRTFRIGKSKAHPIISVLVSNKTIRNETNLKHNALKETPITEVKQYLKKQGFIKVGTNTPNDVLREMFESASLICGELKNYSPDNLLYNYFNTE